jgi:hypothetical protein
MIGTLFGSTIQTVFGPFYLLSPVTAYNGVCGGIDRSSRNPTKAKVMV